MPDLLQISGMTDEMRARLAEVFDITDLREQGNDEMRAQRPGCSEDAVLGSKGIWTAGEDLGELPAP